MKASSNTFVGTSQYMSPELIKGEEATFASDIWALGVILYQMIEGQTPFSSFSEYQVYQKILECNIEF